MNKVLFQTGGPYHPVRQQADIIQQWLPQSVELSTAHSTDAFDLLEDFDLLVAGGLNWSGLGSEGKGHSWQFESAHGYRPANKRHREAFRKYVSAGKPVLGFHGGIASFDDWAEFGHLLGAKWDWKITNHGPIAEWTMNIVGGDHPIASGIQESQYTLQEEEIYVNLQIAQDSDYTVICQAEIGGAKFPVLIVGEGGRIEGSGRWAYFGNGHSLKSFECPSIKPLLLNTIAWLLEG
jgi:type 1 glutamine amidotransferase